MERHSDDYPHEGKRLVRRVGLVLLLAGIGVLGTGVAAVDLLASWLLSR